MLPVNLTRSLQALTISGKSLISAIADTPNPAIKLEPGHQLQGSVQSKISDGLFRVQIAGHVYQMRLPGKIQIGDAIQLHVISTQPSLTFSLGASTNPLSTSEQIGVAARIFSNLANLPLERYIIQQSGNRAVWQAEQAVPDTMLLAGALRETLGKSGLFYESHQAQWIHGERSINQILEEPQNLLTGNGSNFTGVNQSTLSSTADSTRHSTSNQSLVSEGGKSADDFSLPIAKELLNLVQLQLHTLEHHHLVWAGQIWPGQMMQWEIQGEPEQQQQQPEERQWSTEIDLALPKLGDVHARLVFSKDGLSLFLRTTDLKTAELFNSDLPRLKNSLSDANIALLAVSVEKS